MQLLKKSYRQSQSQPIISRNPLIPASQDIFNYFKSSFGGDCAPSRPPSSQSWSKNPNHIIDPSYFSPSCIQNFLNTYPKNISCGQDSIHQNILAALENSKFYSDLSDFFSDCNEKCLTPPHWNLAIVKPIPKMKNSKYISEFRPISLTSIIRRCYEKLFLTYLSTDPIVSPTLYLHESQGGFRSGYSTTSQALLAHESSVGDSKSIKVFVDLKKAYDRVPITKLLTKLENRKLPGNITRIIKSLFTNCSITIAANGKLTKYVQIKIGLFQGSILSPMLFNIFIDDLAEAIFALEKHSISKFPNITIPKLLLFADDIQLHDTSEDEMQMQLDILGKWVIENEMEVNFEKTTVMASFQIKTQLSILDTPLKNESIFVYLGFPFRNCKIDFKTLISNNLEKARRTLQSLRGYQNIWTEYAKLMIFKTYISPIVEYGCGVTYQWIRINWQNRSYLFENLDNFLAEALNWIFNIKGQVSIKLKLTGLCSFEHRFSELAYRLAIHLFKCTESNPTSRFLQAGKGILHQQSILPRCFTHPNFNPNSDFSSYDLRMIYIAEITKGKTLCEVVRFKPNYKKLFETLI